MIPRWSTSKEGWCWPSWCLLQLTEQGSSRGGLLLTRAGAASGPAHVSSQLKREFFWFPVTAKSLGSRCTLFNTRKLQASLGSSGAYPSRAMVGRVLHSPVLLLHMWAGPRLTYSNPCNSAQKLLYFFLTNIIRLGQNFKTLY